MQLLANVNHFYRDTFKEQKHIMMMMMVVII